MRLSDYPDHLLKPRHLEPEEESQPALVFYRLFDYAHLPSLRERLWCWFRLTVTGGFNTESCEPETREQLVSLYEHLARLLEAAHLEYSTRRDELRKLDREINQQSFPQT